MTGDVLMSRRAPKSARVSRNASISREDANARRQPRVLLFRLFLRVPTAFLFASSRLRVPPSPSGRSVDNLRKLLKDHGLSESCSNAAKSKGFHSEVNHVPFDEVDEGSVEVGRRLA